MSRDLPTIFSLLKYHSLVAVLCPCRQALTAYRTHRSRYMVSEVGSGDNPTDNSKSDGCWELHATPSLRIGHTQGERQ